MAWNRPRAKCTQVTVIPYDCGLLRAKTQFGPVLGVPGSKGILGNGRIWLKATGWNPVMVARAQKGLFGPNSFFLWPHLGLNFFGWNIGLLGVHSTVCIRLCHSHTFTQTFYPNPNFLPARSETFCSSGSPTLCYFVNWPNNKCKSCHVFNALASSPLELTLWREWVRQSPWFGVPPTPWNWQERYIRPLNLCIVCLLDVFNAKLILVILTDNKLRFELVSAALSYLLSFATLFGTQIGCEVKFWIFEELSRHLQDICHTTN